MNSTAAVAIAAAAALAKEEEAHMRASYSTKYGYPFWGLRKLESPVDLLAEEDGSKYKFFTSLFGTKYTYHTAYGWSVGIKYIIRYKDASGVAFSGAVITDAVEAASVVLAQVPPEDQKESVEPAEEIPTETPAAPAAAEPILLPKPTAASLPAQAPPSVDIESSPPSPKELDQAVEPQQEPTSTPESPQAQEQEPQTPPAEADKSSSQSPEASSEYNELDEVESQTAQDEEEQDQSAQDDSSSQ
jgi:hypothetical protein